MLGPLLDDSIAILGQKRACRCGENHVWKSTVLKTEGFERLMTYDVSDAGLLTDRWIWKKLVS